jgi:hypothetical protein
VGKKAPISAREPKSGIPTTSVCLCFEAVVDSSGHLSFRENEPKRHPSVPQETQRTSYREAAGHADKGTDAYGKPSVDKAAAAAKQPKHQKQFTQQSQRGVRQRASSDRTG